MFIYHLGVYGTAKLETLNPKVFSPQTETIAVFGETHLKSFDILSSGEILSRKNDMIIKLES